MFAVDGVVTVNLRFTKAHSQSNRTSLPSQYFALLNIASADKVSDTTGNAMKCQSW